MTETILITGASEGIGLEIARQAIASGAQTIVIARDRRKLEAAVANLQASIGRNSLPSTSPTQALSRNLSKTWIGAVLCRIC